MQIKVSPAVAQKHKQIQFLKKRKSRKPKLSWRLPLPSARILFSIAILVLALVFATSVYLLGRALGQENVNNYLERRLSYIFDEPSLRLSYQEEPRGFGQLNLKNVKFFVRSKSKPIMQIDSARFNFGIMPNLRGYFEATVRFLEGGSADIRFEANIFWLVWERLRHFGPARFSGKWVFHFTDCPLSSLLSLNPETRPLGAEIVQGKVSGTIAYMETFPFGLKTLRLKSGLFVKNLQLAGRDGVFIDELNSKVTMGGGKFKAEIGQQEKARFRGRLLEDGFRTLIDLSGGSGAIYRVLVTRIGCPGGRRSLKIEYRREKLRCYG